MKRPAGETVTKISRSDRERWARIDPSTLHEVNREELQRILTKLKGGDERSLTENEKAFLERFSQK